MPRVVHFEIGADDPERAVKFYADVFGWKVERWGEEPYWLVETGEAGAGEEGAGGEVGSGETEPGIGGAIMPREGSNTTVNTISVPSLDEFMAKIEAAGGQAASPKMTIPGIGYHAYCMDTEGNTFGILQEDREAA
ncbi:MAG: VOC family protein [Actinomycetota bacterium]